MAWLNQSRGLESEGCCTDLSSIILRCECCSEELVGGAVEVVAAAVVVGDAGVGVAEGVLDFLKCSTQSEGFGGVGVAEAVWGKAGRAASRATCSLAAFSCSGSGRRGRRRCVR